MPPSRAWHVLAPAATTPRVCTNALPAVLLQPAPQQYCNVEGVAWIDSERLVLTSDKAKGTQDYRWVNDVVEWQLTAKQEAIRMKCIAASSDEAKGDSYES